MMGDWKKSEGATTSAFSVFDAVLTVTCALCVLLHGKGDLYTAVLAVQGGAWLLEKQLERTAAGEKLPFQWLGTQGSDCESVRFLCRPLLPLLLCELAHTVLLLFYLAASPSHRLPLELLSSFLLLALSSPTHLSTVITVKYVGIWTAIGATIGRNPLFFQIVTVGLSLFSVQHQRRLESLQAECQVTRQQLELIKSTVREGIIELDSACGVKSMNEAGRSLTEVKEPHMWEAVSHWQYESLADSSEANSVLGDIQTCFRSRRRSQLLGRTKSAGRTLEWRWVSSGNCCFVLLSDLSEIDRLREELERAQICKQTLFDSISHELRTPTNAIVNLTNSDNFHPASDIPLIHINAQLLLSTIDTIRDFSSVSTGNLTITSSVFDLGSELAFVCGLFRPHCEAKNLTLSLNLDPFLPVAIRSDQSRLREVMLILLGNAVRFTKRGGIRVVATVNRKEKVWIEVADTGIGVDFREIEEVLAFPLSPSSRSKQTTRKKTGLGLGIANIIAKGLGKGGIKVRPSSGGGSRFCFKLVEARRARRESHEIVKIDSHYDVPEEFDMPLYLPQRRESDNDLICSQACPEILIVDDNSFNRMILSKMLSAYGLPSAEASDGQQAIHLLQRAHSAGQRFRLVLMDLDMPVMDGITAARVIAELKDSGDIPRDLTVVACSAYSEQDYGTACLEAGMDTYIEKPISRERIQQLLCDVKLIA